MDSIEPGRARVISLRAPLAAAAPVIREPLWRHVIGDVLRRERLAQERTLKDVADAARISMPYLSELERGRKEASSEVLAAAARALGLRLADLLALAHNELARRAEARPVRAELGPYPGGRGLDRDQASASASDSDSDSAENEVQAVLRSVSEVQRQHSGHLGSVPGTATRRSFMSLAA